MDFGLEAMHGTKVASQKSWFLNLSIVYLRFWVYKQELHSGIPGSFHLGNWHFKWTVAGMQSCIAYQLDKCRKFLILHVLQIADVMYVWLENAYYYIISSIAWFFNRKPMKKMILRYVTHFSLCISRFIKNHKNAVQRNWKS